MLPFAVNLDMSDPEAVRSERHGYVNLVNVVHAELQLIERMAELPGSMKSAIRLCETAADAYREERVALRNARDLEVFARLIADDIAAALAETSDLAARSDIGEAVAIIDEVIPDVDLRVQETLAIHQVPRPNEVRTFGSFAQQLAEAGPDRLELRTTRAISEIEIPYRFAETLGRLLTTLDGAGPDSEDPIIAEIDSTPETLRIVISGSFDPDPLLPLTQEIRPGILMANAELNRDVIRAGLLTWYLVLPDGVITLTRDEDGRRSIMVTIPKPEEN